MTQPAGSTSPAPDARIAIPDAFAQWLSNNRCSLLFTTYQTGKVGSIGLRPDDTISLHMQSYSRALGLAASSTTVWIASLTVMWRLENALDPGEIEDGRFDRLYQPRAAYITGDLDAHEIALDADARPVFANTKYSCLASVSDTHSFQALWKPPFISKLLPEDRCHLNGLCMENGMPAYVTCVSRSDAVEGWRVRRSQSGILMDVRTDTVVAENLSIPHSPRIHNGRVLALESGRGWLVSIDPKTGAKEDIAFCPGFLRGLAVHGDYALATTSAARDGTFTDLPVEDALQRHNQPARCAIHVIDLKTGEIAHEIVFESGITELFDITVLPGVRSAKLEGPQTPQLGSRHSVGALMRPPK